MSVLIFCKKLYMLTSQFVHIKMHIKFSDSATSKADIKDVPSHKKNIKSNPVKNFCIKTNLTCYFVYAFILVIVSPKMFHFIQFKYNPMRPHAYAMIPKTVQNMPSIELASIQFQMQTFQLSIQLFQALSIQFLCIFIKIRMTHTHTCATVKSLIL